MKVFAAGFPQWKKLMGNYYSVSLEYVHDKLAKGESYMLIDARPHRKFLEGSIPSAVSIPDTSFEKMVGLLPTDKSAELIYFCGGYHCKLSHKSAVSAKEIGYANVVVAEAGYPGWKKMYGGSQAVEVQSGGVEGAIDIAQFEKILKENPGQIMVVDVRDPDEFKAGHFPGAVNIPVDELEKRKDELPADKPVVFSCATGARSGEAFYMMMDQRPDLEKVYYLEGTVHFNEDGSWTIKPNK